MFENKKQRQTFKYIMISVSILFALILIKEIFFSPSKLSLPEQHISFPKIDIDFKFLGSDKIKNMGKFKLLPPPKETGRGNPFAEYEINAPSTSSATSATSAETGE